MTKNLGIIFILLLSLSCKGREYKITGKNSYKAGGERYIECYGGEHFKRCDEKISSVVTRYAFALEGGFWVNVNEKEYIKYNIGDIYETKTFQSIKR